MGVYDFWSGAQSDPLSAYLAAVLSAQQPNAFSAGAQPPNPLTGQEGTRPQPQAPRFPMNAGLTPPSVLDQLGGGAARGAAFGGGGYGALGGLMGQGLKMGGSALLNSGILGTLPGAAGGIAGGAANGGLAASGATGLPAWLMSLFA